MLIKRLRLRYAAHNPPCLLLLLLRLSHFPSLQLRGDLSKEEEERLLRQVRERREESERLAAANKARAQRAAELENAFLDIKKATGVNTLEEMVEKFLGQGANRASLEEEKADAEDRLAKVKAQKEAAERRFAELKASGAGETELSRETYDKMDKEIAEVKAQLKVCGCSQRCFPHCVSTLCSSPCFLCLPM